MWLRWYIVSSIRAGPNEKMLLRWLYARLAHSNLDLKKETIYEYDRIAYPEEYDSVFGVNHREQILNGNLGA